MAQLQVFTQTSEHVFNIPENSYPQHMEKNTLEAHLMLIDGWLVISTCKGCNLRQNVGLGCCNCFVLMTLRFGIFF